MKNLIYGIVLAGLIVIGSITLFLYYTQPFEEKFNFVDRVEYGSINFNSYDENGVSYLSSASATLGEIYLKNTGYFTKVYSPAPLTGCLEFTENSGQVYEEISISFDGQRHYYPSYTLNLPPGESRSIKIDGFYDAYRRPLKEYSKENLLGISIYTKESKEENPIKVSDYNNYEYDGLSNCKKLKKYSKPIVSILVS